jgi:hypothetical protein
MWKNYIKLKGTAVWMRFIRIWKGPLANSCGHSSEPKGLKMAGGSYTLALNQLVNDPVI